MYEVNIRLQYKDEKGVNYLPAGRLKPRVVTGEKE